MELVLLPHHNTLTCLQKLQKEAVHEAREAGKLFLPAYPEVCVLGNTAPAAEGKALRQAMEALKARMSGAEGLCSFGPMQAAPADGGSVRLMLPLEVPFLESIRAAGFTAESAPTFALGTLQDQGIESTISLPHNLPSFRAFRLALMQTTPLQDGSSWKFLFPFWVKLR